jgi:predicted small metal-binding protein
MDDSSSDRSSSAVIVIRPVRNTRSKVSPTGRQYGLPTVTRKVTAMHGPIIECPCGAVIRGDSDDEVVEAAQAHAKSVHDMELEREQAQAMLRPG